MKILFDHCVPRPLRARLKPHEVSTARELGWEDYSNGELLRRAFEGGFDVFLTVDQNIRYQQNLASLPMSVLILAGVTSDIDALAACIPRALAAMSGIETMRAIDASVRVVVRVSATTTETFGAPPLL